jgi:hypothetical protein
LPSIAADAADDYKARVEPLPDPEGDAPAEAELVRVRSEGLRDPECRLYAAPRMVLVGDGGAEQRHDAVAQELVDRSLVAVHLGKDQLEDARHHAVNVLGIEALAERGEA